MSESPPQKRLPRNAAPIPFPASSHGTHYLSTSPRSFLSDQPQLSFGQVSDHALDLPTRSPSTYSEIEVVLDDGTLQKRTVSLSTLPEVEQHDTAEESTEEDHPDEEETSCNRHASQEPLETTPLLRDTVPQYASAATAGTYSSSTSNDSDSDEPFFPAKDKGKGKHSYRRVIDDDESTSSYWSKLTSHLRNCSPILTPKQRLVLKCSFAYFLATLFTFIPTLNALIGNNRTSSHLVATATVFFNPAKSLGGMVEAAAYGWGYTLFAVAICLGSMVTTDFFVDRNMYVVAHTISLCFWLAGATFIVSFLKAHWNKPPVATASSLCFIIIFIIVVREGSANRGDFDTTRIEQITSAVAIGTVITVLCCFIFWPVSATKKLKTDLEATLSSYKILLKLLTKTFLLDDDLPEFKANKTLQTAIESHRSSFTSLQKSLKEAKLEAMWNDQVRGRAYEYEQIVLSMQRLAQHVGGLRSSCGIQFERMSGEQDGKQENTWSSLKKTRNRLRKDKMTSGPAQSWNVKPSYRRKRYEREMRRQKTMALPVVDEHPGGSPLPQQQQQHATSQPLLRSLSDQFSESDTGTEYEMENGFLIEFISGIRQPLKSLAYTCKQTIHHLQVHFSSTASPRVKSTVPPFDVLEANLNKAITLFEKSQRHAVDKLQRYRLRHLRALSDSEQQSIDDAPGEDVFLVYFFVFNMTEFARELITLVGAVKRLSEAEERTKKMHWWQIFSKKYRAGPRAPTKRRSSFNAFIPNERNLMNTLHTPAPKTKWRRFFLKMWRMFSMFKLQKIRYAFKAMVAAVLLATPAFLDSTGAWFREWRMEWALITLMVVMTPTVGGTNLVAIYRIFSTVLGCYSAMCFYMLFPANMYVLPVLTWLFSIPNFWLILNHKHGKFGQFTLLAYNLVMLNKYNDREENTVEVWRLALQRCVAILVGVVFGLVATAYVWPYEARVELRKGLSDFLLRLAWLYQKLVSIYSERSDERRALLLLGPDSKGNSCQQLASRESQQEMAKRMFEEVELKMQRSLLDLQDLLAQTPNEPRLKGRFPAETYRAMLGSCQNIVDKFLSMRTVVLKDAWYKDVQKDFIMPVSKERREMVGNVLLYFYLLASALRLKTPLPPYLPPARNAWQSLIHHLRHLPVVQSQRFLDNEQIYVFYYAYVTMMEDIIRELDKLGDSMTRLFGALVPEDQWERLFEVEDPERQSLLEHIQQQDQH